MTGKDLGLRNRIRRWNRRVILPTSLRPSLPRLLPLSLPLSTWHFNKYYVNCRFYGGVYSRDSMPNHIERKFYIINLDDESGPGTHWVVLYNLRKKPIYFDSFGVWPPKELGQIENLVINEYRIQSFNSSSCGLYCVCIIEELLAGRKFVDILSDFSPSDFLLNERKISSMLGGI